MNGIQMEKIRLHLGRCTFRFLLFIYGLKLWGILSDLFTHPPQNHKTEGGSISGEKKTRMITENLETQNVSCFFDTKIT